MRRAQLLVNEARQNTNTQDQTEAIPDTLLFQLLNRIQSYIQDFIASSGVKNKFNSNVYDFTTIVGQNEYDLPYDIFNSNSVNAVWIVLTDGPRQKFIPMTNISEKSQTNEFGYVLRNNKIIMPPFDFSNYFIRVSYAKKVPDLNLRYGKIKTVNANSLVLDVGYGTGANSLYDYFSVVDASGEIIKYNMDFTSQVADTIATGDTTGISVGQFVIPGYYASSHSQLVDSCEKILLTGLEKLIMARLSSRDIEIASAIDGSMLSQVMETLADNSADDFAPPILQNKEWFF